MSDILLFFMFIGVLVVAFGIIIGVSILIASLGTDDDNYQTWLCWIIVSILYAASIALNVLASCVNRG